MTRLGAAALASLLCASLAMAAGASFDYYVLALSWAPDFCAAPGGAKDPRECAPGRRLGFVVHGLWPQSEQGRGPENCGAAGPVPAAVLGPTLAYVPTESLVRHEWRTHGTCSGLAPEAYFAALRKARDAVKIPAAFTDLTRPATESAAQIERAFASANPRYPPAAFRATCANGALQEIRICLDKTLTARACTASAGHCSAPAMKILPPR